jgi:hypothetical protein
VAGSTFKLQYNRYSGPMGAFPVPEDQVMLLKIGHNGWKAVQEAEMKRAAGMPASDAEGEAEREWNEREEF